MMTSDRQERARVRSRIGSLILEFCRHKEQFHMKDLTRFVEKKVFLGGCPFCGKEGSRALAYKAKRDIYADILTCGKGHHWEPASGNRVAPDSPGRILRQLRQQRLLNYEVVSRRQSLYRVLPVERPAEQAELFGGVVWSSVRDG